MSTRYYGPKFVAEMLEVEMRVAKEIVTAIADVEVYPRVWRVSAGRWAEYCKAREDESKVKLEGKKSDGNVSRKEEALGSKKKTGQWQAA